MQVSPGQSSRAQDEIFFYAVGEDVPDSGEQGVVIDNGLSRKPPLPKRRSPIDEWANFAGDIGFNVADKGRDVVRFLGGDDHVHVVANEDPCVGLDLESLEGFGNDAPDEPGDAR